MLSAVIQPVSDLLEPLPPRRPRPPWESHEVLSRLALAVLWTSGPDPARDQLQRLLAWRRGADGAWEHFDVWCHPEPGRPRPTAGVPEEWIDGALEREEACTRFCDFLKGRPVLTLAADSFAPWVREPFEPGEVQDLASLAGLLLPGPLARRGAGLASSLLELSPEARLEPEQLLEATARLIERALEREEAVLTILGRGLERVWSELVADHNPASATLALALQLLEYPSHLGLGGDGRLSDALRAFETIDDALEATVPPCGANAREEARIETLATLTEDEPRLDVEDKRLVEEIFREHLPAHFAEEGASYRRGQHAVAEEIATAFGQKELLLVHAPTGTGKTLAYLVPTVLWAYRNAVRVGVATFTRALQEQAMERDVPIARALLKRAGLQGEPRIATLKGRDNYLCWRSLKLQAPLANQQREETLAWTVLTLFALADPDSDLDRLPQHLPLRGLSEKGWRTALRRLVYQARSEQGCCAHSSDRESCGARAARRRAERAHLVVTNHALAMARRDFFRHIVFDECEHLHDVAHNAFSTSVRVGALVELLERLYQDGGSRRAPLNRVLSVSIEGSEAAVACHACIDAHNRAEVAIHDLRQALGLYKLWREDAAADRKENDLHSLFREYVLGENPAPLLEAHRALEGALNDLVAGLAQLAEHLDTLPTRSVRKLRRTIETLRTDLEERHIGVRSWIPRTENGVPDFRPETFHDLETTPNGEDVLAARVLLPHEYLGRRYYPELRGAVFLSATTWLRGGFESQATYLGLTRAAEPAPDEERQAQTLRTLRAPEAFDYGRVLVAVPRDAPSVRTSKRAFLTYVARFLGYLAERTRGRVLALFTNAEDTLQTGRALEGFFERKGIAFWYQRMEGAAKEELADRFRQRIDSVLLGLDTFWYGADFPGPTLEHLVLVRLPYGVPDRYHHAQCAALGTGEQRRQIYLPRALSKLRQGFGRLMRKETDRGCVYLLDGRILDPRHRSFLRELPVTSPFDDKAEEPGARLVYGDTDRCFEQAFLHMGLAEDVRTRGLERSFSGWRLTESQPQPDEPREERVEISEDELPF